MKEAIVSKPTRRFESRQGSVLVLVTVFMIALFAFAALSIDVGNTLVQRKRIHEAADAAALAAVADWARGKSATEVGVLGANFASANDLAAEEILAIEPGTWNHASRTFAGPLATLPANSVPAVRVVAKRSVSMAFARVIGLSEMNPRVESVAVVARATAAAGALPWAVCDSFTPAKCVTITVQMKDGGETNACSASGPISGNFGQLTFPGGSGASWYKQNIENGYQGILRVGQCVATDPGVSWGPTKQGIDDRLDRVPAYTCTSTSEPPTTKRLGIIPVVEDLDVSGKKAVCITGFYVGSLDGYNNSRKSVTVTFLEVFAGTEVDPSSPPVPGQLAGVALVR